MMTFSDPPVGQHTPNVISTASRCAGSGCLPAAGTSYASATSVTTTAVFVPFYVTEAYTWTRGYVSNGSGTMTGNVDIGVYNEAGTRLASTGNTALAGVSAVQVIAFTSSVVLNPGRYYMAISYSAGTANNVVAIANTVTFGRYAGLYRQTSANPLPATATFATWASQVLPAFGISQYGF